MMKVYVILLVAVVLLSLGKGQIPMTRETSECERRQTPGLICETCELLATCVRHSNGWLNIPVESCDTSRGYYCNARLGKCSNTTGPCHPFGYEGSFPCTSHGIFPDPYDCQKYHMCYYVDATLVSATVDCSIDKAFDANTGQCTLTLDHAVCQQKQFNCLQAGDAFAWPNSPIIFYVCKATFIQEERVLYPTLYRCNDGTFFNGYYCLHSNTTQANIPTMPMIPNLTATLPNTNENITTTKDIKNKCTDIGLFSDEENCSKYYHCSAVNGLLQHMECPLGTFFNALLSACEVGNC